MLAGIAAVAAALPVSSSFAASGPACIVQESGTLASWPLVIAALVASDPGRVDSAIEELRRSTGYWRPLKLSSSDVNRVPFGKALIDLFVNDHDLRLVAQVATTAGGWPKGAAERDRRYFTRYLDVLGRAVGEPAAAKLQLQRNNNLRGELLTATLRERHGGVVASGATDNLPQLAGLLASCIRADHLGTTDASRLELIAYLKDRLGIPGLATGSNSKMLVQMVGI